MGGAWGLRYDGTMKTSSLPPIPASEGDNLLGRLLVTSMTDNKLAWELLPKVDAMSTVDGQPLLQVFCEQYRGKSVFRMPLAPDARLPSFTGEPWPDPLYRSQSSSTHTSLPSAAMWIAASLIVNGPDPFAWRTDKQEDILDFVVTWRNDHLFRQLMRMPTAPGLDQLRSRTRAGKPATWLHELAADSAGTYLILQALLDMGMDPNQRDAKGNTPLHAACGQEAVKVLLSAGADPLARNTAGASVVDSWANFAYGTKNDKSYVFPPMFNVWTAALGPTRLEGARAHAAEAVCRIAKKDRVHIASEMGQAMGVPLPQWHAQVGGRDLSLLSAMALEAARRRKDRASSNLSTVLKEAVPADLTHVSIRDLQDMDLIWVAASSEHNGRAKGGSEAAIIARMVELMEADGASEEQAHLRLLEASLTMSRQPPFQGKNIDEAINNALNRQAAAMADELQGNTAVTPYSGLLARHLHLLPAFLNNRVEDNYVRSFVVALPCLAKLAGDEHLSQLLLTWAQSSALKTFTNPNLAPLYRTCFAEAGARLIEMGAQWDPTLPGAEEGLSALSLLGRRVPEVAGVAASLEEQWLSRNTPQATSPGARGPRL